MQAMVQRAKEDTTMTRRRNRQHLPKSLPHQTRQTSKGRVDGLTSQVIGRSGKHGRCRVLAQSEKQASKGRLWSAAEIGNTCQKAFHPRQTSEGRADGLTSQMIGRSGKHGRCRVLACLTIPIDRSNPNTKLAEMGKILWFGVSALFAMRHQLQAVDPPLHCPRHPSSSTSPIKPHYTTRQRGEHLFQQRPS
ncbi:hypothetical protein E6O75_ATG01438 [Venturia nashicola]|uniref:Uncharacterized protein n=1 Tax=Venturia nashicola TaxID=86259 RepID=A0A4Z1PS32_9PEZI|nr:hypothetical protein E6O75_ATG01438 [Venturia nashicola]